MSGYLLLFLPKTDWLKLTRCSISILLSSSFSIPVTMTTTNSPQARSLILFLSVLFDSLSSVTSGVLTVVILSPKTFPTQVWHSFKGTCSDPVAGSSSSGKMQPFRWCWICFATPHLFDPDDPSSMSVRSTTAVTWNIYGIIQSMNRATKGVIIFFWIGGVMKKLRVGEAEEGVRDFFLWK